MRQNNYENKLKHNVPVDLLFSHLICVSVDNEQFYILMFWS